MCAAAASTAARPHVLSTICMKSGSVAWRCLALLALQDGDLVPGYYDKIKQPMCFHSMRVKLQAREYRSACSSNSSSACACQQSLSQQPQSRSTGLHSSSSCSSRSSNSSGSKCKGSLCCLLHWCCALSLGSVELAALCQHMTPAAAAAAAACTAVHAAHLKMCGNGGSCGNSSCELQARVMRLLMRTP